MDYRRTLSIHIKEAKWLIVSSVIAGLLVGSLVATAVVVRILA